MIEQNVLRFKLELTDELLTPHAGLVLAHEFHLGLGLDGLLDEHLPPPLSNRGYSPSEVVLPLVLMLLGGGRSLEDIGVIAGDWALREAAELRRVPAATTLGDWLRRLGNSGAGMSGLARVNDRLTGCRYRQGVRTDHRLDVDATIIAAHKADATRAYEGTVGYHPMLGFLDDTRWLLHDEFRTGSEAPQANGVAFIEACRDRMPAGHRIAEVRSDSAFYNHAVTDHCQGAGMIYTIAAAWDPAVVAAYRSILATAWTPVPVEKGKPHREVAETMHGFNHGNHGFRLVFIRDIDEQGTLFQADHRGRGVITNAAMEHRSTAQVIAHYNRRGTAENYIKELKHGFGMPCGQQPANATWFRIGVLAYNLFLLQQAFGLPPELLHVTVGTVRWRLCQVAARLVRHARRLVLKVATDAATFATFSDLRIVSRSLAAP
jgi:Transposase DDE domain group 1